MSPVLFYEMIKPKTLAHCLSPRGDTVETRAYMLKTMIGPDSTVVNEPNLEVQKMRSDRTSQEEQDRKQRARQVWPKSIWRQHYDRPTVRDVD